MASTKDISQTDTGLYDNPSWYDILHTRHTAWEVDGLEAIASRFVRSTIKNRPARWLEPACGTARYLREAAKRGVEVCGYDLSPSMIAYARERFDAQGLEGTLDVGDFTTYVPRKKADFAFNLINTLRHLMTDADALAHLECVARSLTKGGVYAVGISTADYETDEHIEDIWTGGRGQLRITQMVQFLPPNPATRIEKVINHLCVRTPTRETHADSTYDLRTYSRTQWLELIDRSPFDLLAITDEFGDAVPVDDDGVYGGRYGVYLLGVSSHGTS